MKKRIINMKFKGLTEFIDIQCSKHEKTQSTHDQLQIVFTLIEYLNTTLSSEKFKYQRQYCKEAIKKLNPSFYEGYFKEKRL